MTKEEQNELVKQYIDKKIEETNKKYPGLFTEEHKNKFYKHFDNYNENYQETINIINFVIEEAIHDHLNPKKEKLPKQEKKEEIVYKTEEEKQAYIREYIDKKIEETNEKYPGFFTEEHRQRAYEHFKNNKKDSYEELKNIMDFVVEEAIQDHLKDKENRVEQVKKPKTRKLTKSEENKGFINIYILITIIILMLAIVLTIIYLLNK